MIPSKQTQKGRTYLIVLTILGLAFPLSIAAFTGFLAISDLLREEQFLNLWEFWSLVTAFSLAAFVVGFWLARMMFKGKVWAKKIWSYSGILMGIFFVISPVIDEMDWYYAILGIFLAAIGILSAEQKDVRAYLDSIAKDEKAELIDKIGTTD